MHDDRYHIVYRRPVFTKPGDPVPLTVAEYRGAYQIVDLDLPGFGDCALPGVSGPMQFSQRVHAEAFLQRCYKAWGLRPDRGQEVPLIQ
jgi:hypothetical protein